MKKLLELLPLDPTKGSFGIEIECEGQNLQRLDNGVWMSTADGSLRGHFPDSAVEWVLEKPVELAKAITAVNALSKFQEQKGALPKFSYRTSVHVHVNVQQLTEDEYLNLLYTYMLIEEPLIRFCGAQRRANRFCLSINNGEGILDHMNMIFRRGVEALRVIPEDAVRYAAMNIAATRKYGSVEFRSMRGTLDVDVLTTWLLTLNSIREFAKEHKDVTEIHDKFVKMKPIDFFRSIVGDEAPELEYKEIEADLRNNFSITLELVYAYQQSRQKKMK